jgi:hypothetical protein
MRQAHAAPEHLVLAGFYQYPFDEDRAKPEAKKFRY